MRNGLALRNGFLTLGFAHQMSRFSKEISIIKRDAEGKKTGERVTLQTNSGPKLNWFMHSNGGEQRKSVELTPS